MMSNMVNPSAPFPDAEQSNAEKEQLWCVEEMLSLQTVPVPAMNIVIMIVGTRGDVQPFFGLGRLACASNVQLDCHSQFCEAAVHSRLNEPSYRLLFVLTGHKLVEDGHRVRDSKAVFMLMHIQAAVCRDIPHSSATLQPLQHASEHCQ
eukprot:16980-Heterococcus_DN1.PRE.3